MSVRGLMPGPRAGHAAPHGEPWLSTSARVRQTTRTGLAPFHPLVQGAFYIFVASIPFEYPARSIPVEVTTLTAALFLLVALVIQPLRCFQRAPAALWCFGVYLYVFWVSFGTTGGAYAGEAWKSFISFLQLVLVFWAAVNLLRDEQVATRAMLTLGLAVVLLAVLTVGGAVHLDEDWIKASGRLTLFGQNANRAGIILASGALSLVGLTYARDRKLFRPRWLAWPLIGLIVYAILKGGSRGSLLALTIGLCTFAMGGRSVVLKLRNAVVALLAIGLLAWAAWQVPLTRSRFERIEQADLAGRQLIFPAAVRLFLEKPFTGWGPNANKYELAERVPERGILRQDTHNLVLGVLTATGLLGGVPFFLGAGLCVWGAWRARRGPHGILPFVLLITVLAANMSSNYVALKLFWLVMALGAAVGSAATWAPLGGRRRC